MPTKKPKRPAKPPRKDGVVQEHKLKPKQIVTVKNIQPARPKILRVFPGESYRIIMSEDGPGESSASPREKQG